MKKCFVEADVEVTLISALEDILEASANEDASKFPDEDYGEDW